MPPVLTLNLPTEDATDPVSYIRELKPVRRFGRLLTLNPSMCAVFELLDTLAKTEVTITFTGETGTGKDVLAKTIHEQSARAKGNFVVFDCGGVAPSLAESELYGHEKGSFTGAHAFHLGAFERAQGGTLFLDEIGELPLSLQPRLLRVLENRTVRRVGGGQDRALDVRVLAATNRDLRADVEAGKFRQDLYFRLAGAEVLLPPLRERPEDMALLASAILADLGAPDLSITPTALKALQEHAWPGNVRELKNTLSCARHFLVDAGALDAHHLRLPPASKQPSPLDLLLLSGHSLQSIERAAIQQTLAAVHGNKASAARSLGIALSTLYEKLHKYRIAS